jgi:hypothetical protein
MHNRYDTLPERHGPLVRHLGVPILDADNQAA